MSSKFQTNRYPTGDPVNSLDHPGEPERIHTPRKMVRVKWKEAGAAAAAGKVYVACPSMHEDRQPSAEYHHCHHVPEGLGVLSCSLILKMKLVPPPLPWSSRVPSSFWSIL